MHKTFLVAVGLVLFSFLDTPSKNYRSGQNEYPNLIWSDEFTTDGPPDPARWSFDTGDGCPKLCGWGNNELQYYTNSEQNVWVEDGKLILEARQEKKGNKDYTSARITTKGKKSLNRGCIEIRAMLSKGVGTWPAIWLLPVKCDRKGWLACGEIDIAEYVGFHPGEIYSAIHTQGLNVSTCQPQGGMIRLGEPSEMFHVYSTEWTDQQIIFKVDEVRFFTFDKQGDDFRLWPFDRDFYLIMNIAVGGNWGGLHGIDPCPWPQRMEVDYVRMYQ